jgi:ABC-2 type transport system ATP-binding protein
VLGVPRADSRRRIEELLVQYDFADRQKQLAGTLSGGQKQRLALAGAVIHKPELLFLDEPTSAVDPESRRDFWEKLFDLADTGTTLLVSTHYMDEAERCHRLAILDHGRLVADGTPVDLTAALAGRSLVVHAAAPRRAQKVLTAIPGVLSVAQIGNALRVLCDDGNAAADRIRAALRQSGIDADIESGTPNLEDVFVASTGRQGAAAERAA